MDKNKPTGQQPSKVGISTSLRLQRLSSAGVPDVASRALLIGLGFIESHLFFAKGIPGNALIFSDAATKRLQKICTEYGCNEALVVERAVQIGSEFLDSNFVNRAKTPSKENPK
ncbi:MAG: hypothetical protein K9N10_22780 [Deltaproteobacteria bacterium]|nr:hypothetical protein [Deltaproteobacteria bacterium]